jgi:hypothetical protein
MEVSGQLHVPAVLDAVVKRENPIMVPAGN